ncbi:MAG: hypothetical protein VKI63_04295 [Cyanobium sp.]|nr:hypothetical protein [Cyanobium sp.]
MPSADTLPPPPATHQPQIPNQLPDLLDAITAATLAIKAWDDHKRALLIALSVHHDLGHVDDRITHDGWQLQWSPGRQSYDYPESVIELEASLQAAREAAVVAGTAVLKPSTPFWTVRPPRPSKGSQEAV